MNTGQEIEPNNGPATQSPGNSWDDSFTPLPTGAVISWLRSRKTNTTSRTSRVLLVDPRRGDDAITLRRWGCEVMAMFSNAEQSETLRQLLEGESIDCITGDFFDLKTSWSKAIDLIVMDCDDSPPPSMLRQVAIRMLSNCLTEGGRIIVITHAETQMQHCIRQAAPLLMMMSSESSFDPYDGHEHDVIVAERTGVNITAPPMPASMIRKFPL